MATQYQRIMRLDDPTKVDSVYDTVTTNFIPLDDRNPSYQKVLAYCAGLGITINDLDLFTP